MSDGRYCPIHDRNEYDYDCILLDIGYHRWRRAELPWIPLLMLTWLLGGIVLAAYGGNLPLHDELAQGVTGGMGAGLIVGALAMLPPVKLSLRVAGVIAGWGLVGLIQSLIYAPHVISLAICGGLIGGMVIVAPLIAINRVAPRLVAESRSERIAALEHDLSDLIGGSR